MAELTERQEKFVEEYLKSSNATQAAIAAGYASKAATVMGSKLRANPNVQKALRKTHDKTVEEIKITKTEVMKKLSKLADKAENADQYNAANKSWELISKMLGFFELDKTLPQDYNVELAIPDLEEANP